MKKNNSLLLTILGGAIFCFVFLGMAFIFTNSTKIMRGNNYTPITSEEEINLGDSTNHCARSESYCPTGSKSGDRCVSETTSSTGPDDCEGGSWSNGICHKYEDLGPQSTRCVECDSNFILQSGTCVQGSCFCNSDRTACSWSTAGSSTTPNVVSGINSESACVGNTVRSCCYDSGTNYVFGNTASSNCIGFPNNIITSSATCASQNPYKCFCNSDRTACTWGKTGSSTTPNVASDINSESACVGNTVRTCCYKNSSGEYVMGNKSSNECYGFPNNIVSSGETCSKINSCKITVHNDSGFKHMSIDELESAHFEISDPSVCGSEVEIKVKNFYAPSGGTVTGRVDNYRPTTACVQGEISGCIKGSTICTTNSIKIDLRPKWSGPSVETNVPVSKATPNSAAAANQAGVDYYYVNCEGETNGVYTKCDKYTRGCGPSGTTSPKCYEDEQGGYHWTTHQEPNWKIVSGISKKEFCESEEPNACYVNPEGTYVWGQYAKTEGYTVVTSINDQTTCESQAGVCYKNNYDSYRWSETKPEACIEVNSCWIPKEQQNNPPETCTYTTQESCEETEGYVEVPGITNPKDCRNGNEACYVRESDGEWVWGDYGDVTGYYELQYEDGTPVPEDMCNNEVPVPKTDMNIAKIVYICMAVLMACGVGFIYYSTVMKKEN